MAQGAEHRFNQLVVGCTFAGLGRILAEPDGSLIVESSAMIGGEWIEAFDPGSGWNLESDHPATEALRQELIRRGAVAGAGVHIPAVGPVLAERLRESCACYLFFTDVLSVRETTPGFEAELETPDGRRTVRARRIVDTTTRSATRRPALTPLREKRLHAALNFQGDSREGPGRIEGPSFRVLPGLFRREGWLSLDMPLDVSFAEARDRLCAFWSDRPASLREWNLAAIAERFAERPLSPSSPCPDWMLLPSRLQDAPLDAFRAGAEAFSGKGR